VVAGTDISPLELVPVMLFILGTPIFGALIAVRRPGNPTGWLFLLLALGFSASFASDDLARHAAPGPQVAWLVLIGQDLGNLGLVSLALLVMFFPTGSLPSRRWRIVPIVAIIAAISSAIASLFAPGSPVTPPVVGLINPLAMPAWGPELAVLGAIGFIGLGPVAIGTVALLFVRIRRSRGAERQQLKWFAAAGSVSAFLLLGLVVNGLAGRADIGDVLWAATISSLVLLPAAAGIAILRYRLYDIDRIVSRTISYGVLTTFLVAVFMVVNLALQAVLSSVMANNAWAVAGSTLLAAALFTPLRLRVQHVVDRRFNRARYDADRTIAWFSDRLRDEVDLPTLTSELDATVRRAIAPSGVGLWLRGGKR
jgi:hypothetical protein